MLLRLVFYTICKWWNKSLRNVGSMRRCGFKRSEIYEVQQFQFLFHHILQLPFHHILRHLHFSRELFRPDLELFLGILRHSNLCHTSFEALCVSSTSLFTPDLKRNYSSNWQFALQVCGSIRRPNQTKTFEEAKIFRPYVSNLMHKKEKKHSMFIWILGLHKQYLYT